MRESTVSLVDIEYNHNTCTETHKPVFVSASMSANRVDASAAISLEPDFFAARCRARDLCLNHTRSLSSSFTWRRRLDSKRMGVSTENIQGVSVENDVPSVEIPAGPEILDGGSCCKRRGGEDGSGNGLDHH